MTNDEVMTVLIGMKDLLERALDSNDRGAVTRTAFGIVDAIEIIEEAYNAQSKQDTDHG